MNWAQVCVVTTPLSATLLEPVNTCRSTITCSVWRGHEGYGWKNWGFFFFFRGGGGVEQGGVCSVCQAHDIVSVWEVLGYSKRKNKKQDAVIYSIVFANFCLLKEIEEYARTPPPPPPPHTRTRTHTHTHTHMIRSRGSRVIRVPIVWFGCVILRVCCWIFLAVFVSRLSLLIWPEYSTRFEKSFQYALTEW